MSKLTSDDVVHVASLAKINLTKAEITKFQKQLSEVVSFIASLNQVDTEKVKPTSQTTGIENSLREDKLDLTESLSQKDATSGTDNLHNGYFKVPMILEEKEDY